MGEGLGVRVWGEESKPSLRSLRSFAATTSHFLALTAEAGFARLIAVKLVVRQFARVCATPGLGGETAKRRSTRGQPLSADS